MEKVINCIKKLVNAMFTGKVILHFHLGRIKKITKEEEIT